MVTTAPNFSFLHLVRWVRLDSCPYQGRRLAHTERVQSCDVHHCRRLQSSTPLIQPMAQLTQYTTTKTKSLCIGPHPLYGIPSPEKCDFPLPVVGYVDHRLRKRMQTPVSLFQVMNRATTQLYRMSIDTEVSPRIKVLDLVYS